MAIVELSDLATYTAGADLSSAPAGSLLRLSSGKVILTSAATDVVDAILAVGAPSDGAVSAYPINRAHKVPILMGAAAAIDRLLVPDASGGNNGKATSVANIAALVANQVSFGKVLEAATAEDDVITGHIQVIAGPTA